jgi:hypothetical protein
MLRGLGMLLRLLVLNRLGRSRRSDLDGAGLCRLRDLPNEFHIKETVRQIGASHFDVVG